MSVAEIKRGIASFSPSEQGDVTAFLLHLRPISDAEYQERVASRLSDHDKAHWRNAEEFERRLEQR